MTTGPHDHGFEPDEPGADQLRSVLTSAAASVQPTDGSLGRILTTANHRSPWTWGAPLLAAAAALVLVVSAGVYASTRGTASPTTHQPGSQSPSASSLPSSPSTGPSASPSPSSTATGNGPVVGLYVYYGASYNGQTRLYRETHRVHTTDAVKDAIRHALDVAPQDSDYRGLWPAKTSLLDYWRVGPTAYVRLTGASPASASKIAVQQLVYTITANDKAVHGVAIAYGQSGAFDIAQTRGAAIDVLGIVWLLQPTLGATESSPVTLSGTAMVFEATVNWEVDRPDGTIVQSGNAMTPEAFVNGPWSTTVQLPPGDYVAKAYEASAKDGSKTWIDSKPFTVH
jgi:hypothetical protein